MNVVVRLTFLAACAILVIKQLSSLQSGQMFELLDRVGWMVLLVLISASAATIADTMGWMPCITKGSGRVTLAKLLPIRLSCDAVCNSLPAGIAPGETLRALLLRDRCGIDMTEGAACCLLGKVNMALAHMAYICIVVLFLYLGIGGTIRIDLLPGGSTGLLGGGCAAALLIVVLIQPYAGPRLSQMFRGIGRIRWEALQRLARRLAPHLARIDTHVSEFARSHPVLLRRSLVSFFAGWVALGSESVVILLLLGVNISPLAGLALEAVVSVLRILFFILPSALGAAELAYIAFLTALGVPDPVTLSAAFIAIKRLREALWIVLGYAVLAKIMPVGRERPLQQLIWRKP